jgi:hypothetical protein
MQDDKINSAGIGRPPEKHASDRASQSTISRAATEAAMIEVYRSEKVRPDPDRAAPIEPDIIPWSAALDLIGKRLVGNAWTRRESSYRSIRLRDEMEGEKQRLAIMALGRAARGSDTDNQYWSGKVHPFDAVDPQQQLAIMRLIRWKFREARAEYQRFAVAAHVLRCFLIGKADGTKRALACLRDMSTGRRPVLTPDFWRSDASRGAGDLGPVTIEPEFFEGSHDRKVNSHVYIRADTLRPLLADLDNSPERLQAIVSITSPYDDPVHPGKAVDAAPSAIGATGIEGPDPEQEATAILRQMLADLKPGDVPPVRAKVQAAVLGKVKDLPERGFDRAFDVPEFAALRRPAGDHDRTISARKKREG